MVLPPDAYEAIAVLTLPVMAMMMYAMIKLGRSPIGQALARRISGEPRLDFAERLLAQADENGTRLLPREWNDISDASIATPV
jgi:hypothetical protein